jgi:hypothetical protein
MVISQILLYTDAYTNSQDTSLLLQFNTFSLTILIYINLSVEILILLQLYFPY